MSSAGRRSIRFTPFLSKSPVIGIEPAIIYKNKEKPLSTFLSPAHGDLEKVDLGGKKVREYLAADTRHPTLKDVERCLFWSCAAGVDDGEAEHIAQENGDLTVYAPRSTVYSQLSFLELDTARKPTIYHFSELSSSLITKIFKKPLRRGIPIEPSRIDALCENRDARKAVANWETTLSLRSEEGCQASTQVLQYLKGGSPQATVTSPTSSSGTIAPTESSALTGTDDGERVGGS